MVFCVHRMTRLIGRPGPGGLASFKWEGLVFCRALRHISGLCHGLGSRGILFVVKQLEKLGAGHLAQHGGRHGVRPGIVVNVNIEPVHHVVMRVGKQLFHGRVAHLRGDTARDKGLEVGLGGETLNIVQRQRRSLGRAGWRAWPGSTALIDRVGVWRGVDRRRLRARRWGARVRRIHHHRNRLGGWFVKRLARPLGLLALRPAAQKTLSHAHPPIFFRY